MSAQYIHLAEFVATSNIQSTFSFTHLVVWDTDDCTFINKSLFEYVPDYADEKQERLGIILQTLPVQFYSSEKMCYKPKGAEAYCTTWVKREALHLVDIHIIHSQKQFPCQCCKETGVLFILKGSFVQHTTFSNVVGAKFS